MTHPRSGILIAKRLDGSIRMFVVDCSGACVYQDFPVAWQPVLVDALTETPREPTEPAIVLEDVIEGEVPEFIEQPPLAMAPTAPVPADPMWIMASWRDKDCAGVSISGGWVSATARICWADAERLRLFVGADCERNFNDLPCLVWPFRSGLDGIAPSEPHDLLSGFVCSEFAVGQEPVLHVADGVGDGRDDAREFHAGVPL